MKEPVLVSIYITNYNYARFLSQSIESVYAQDFSQWELIIIDDGSTDHSREIIEQYRDRPEVSIIYQQNKGLNITNNVAMRVARGKYLMRLDADDYLHPQALSKMIVPLEQSPELGLVFPDYYYVDAEGHITGEERRHNFEREVSLYDQPAHGACTMIRLDFLKKIGGYNESFTCQDGYDLWLKFITHYSVSNVNQPLFYYRRHGENLTTNEERILATRRAIKASFLRREQGENATLVVVPLRHTRIGGQSWPLQPLAQGQSLLENRVEEFLKAQSTAAVYLLSEDAELLDYARKLWADEPRVGVFERPVALAAPTQTLGRTVALAVEQAQAAGLNYHCVMTATIDYPFTSSEVLDDAVNTLFLFGSDAVLTVRPDNRMYYRHGGHGLEPILDQEKFLRVEREALYRAAGGIMVARKASFAEHGRINAGKISHVVVDEQCAFGVFSAFDQSLFKVYQSAQLRAKESD